MNPETVAATNQIADSFADIVSACGIVAILITLCVVLRMLYEHYQTKPPENHDGE